MTRFVDEQKSTEGAINVLADTLVQAKKTTRTSKTDGAATLTVGECINGLLVVSGTPGAFALTYPTAAAIVAALENCQIGDSFDFTVVNGGDGTITLTTNTGITVAGTATIATLKSQLVKGIVTAVATPAVTMQAILTAPI